MVYSYIGVLKSNNLPNIAAGQATNRFFPTPIQIIVEKSSNDPSLPFKEMFQTERPENPTGQLDTVFQPSFF
ncbi:MAG: hypothetical protein AB1Z38_05795 [Desulfotignum sp.]